MGKKKKFGFMGKVVLLKSFRNLLWLDCVRYHCDLTMRHCCALAMQCRLEVKGVIPLQEQLRRQQSQSILRQSNVKEVNMSKFRDAHFLFVSTQYV